MASRQLVFLLSALFIFTVARRTCADPVSYEGSFLKVKNNCVCQLECAGFELRQLEWRISFLETSIDDQKVNEDQTNSLASLQREAHIPQEKGSSKLKEQTEEVNSPVTELEKQVVQLKKEIELQCKKRDELKLRVNAIEGKIEGPNFKLKSRQRINNEQEARIHDIHRALKVAEEEMLKAQLEASSLTKQLNEVQKAWLPHWASVHTGPIQLFFSTHWNKNGRSVFYQAIQKALKQKREVEKWVQPHFKAIKSKWSSIIKDQYNDAGKVLNAPIQSLTTQAINYFHVAWGIIEPLILNIQEAMDSYIQEVKMLMRPYNDQSLDKAKPHLDRSSLILKPYSTEVASYHEMITKKIRVFYSRVQAALYETLNNHKLKKPLATEAVVLYRVQKAWLPHWASVHISRIQIFFLTHKNGRPTFYQAIQKALKKKCEVEKWGLPHLETIKSKWFSIIEEQYNGAWSIIEPLILNIQEAMDSYIQEVKMWVRPYIDRVGNQLEWNRNPTEGGHKDESLPQP